MLFICFVVFFVFLLTLCLSVRVAYPFGKGSVRVADASDTVGMTKCHGMHTKSGNTVLLILPLLFNRQVSRLK